jgi:hypothetical protein
MKGMDSRLVTAIFAVGAFGALFTAGAALVWGRAAAFSVAAGAGIAAANLYVLARIVGAILRDPDDAGRKGGALVWGLAALIKMLLLFGGLWILMAKGLVLPVALVGGYLCLPIGIAIGSLVSDKAAPRMGSS